MSEANYKTIQEKMIGPETIPIDSLIVSEYNTRCSFVEQGHVEHLALLIRERGFNPTRPLLVNVIRDAAGEIIAKRLVAGLHRYEGSRLAELSAIPCILYEGLTPEEETLLDRWDNEMDEEHKPVHFLAEAEHYKYLAERKGWSQRQIARSKGVSKTSVVWKMQIASLPEEIKALVRGGHHGDHLTERHMREAMKLGNPAHIILILKEIAERGEAAKEGTEGECERRNEQSPMKQREVEARVKELLEIESRGEVSPQVEALIQEAEQAEEEEQQARCLEGETGSRGRPEPPHLPPQIARKVQQETEMEMSEEERAALEQLRREQEEWLIEMGPLGKPSKKRTTEEMKFDVMPRWLGHSSLRGAFGSDWDLFEQLVKSDLRYLKGSKRKGEGEGEGYFFIEGKESGPEGSYKYLAQLTAQKTVGTVQKKLRGLVKKGYIEMQQLNLPRYPRFRVVWSKLQKVYDKEAFGIPYQEGGLEGLPGTFSGTLHPTPVHTIYVIDGVVAKENAPVFEEVVGLLERMGAGPKLVKKLLAEHSFWSIREALNEYQRTERTAPQKANGTGKQRPVDVFMGFLKGSAAPN